MTNAPYSAQAHPGGKYSLEVSPEQAEQLQFLLEVTKALASPVRLAIIGAVAARAGQSLSQAELAGLVELAPARLERDLRQLIESGLLAVEEWQANRPGLEPAPARVGIHPEYLKRMPRLITTLHQLTTQLQPATPSPALDERAKTIGRFIKNGRLLGFPTQFKRQKFVLEEIARNFEPGMRYSERQVDAILKQVYEHDHCTLRRYLVDLHFLRRENGIYWKPEAALPAV